MTLPGVVYAYNLPRWKHPVVRQCFPQSTVTFIKVGGLIPAGVHLILWGMAPIPDDAPEDVQVLRMEDGFLRSVGLGADLVRPLSWVVDARGIYYDATRPSDLEHILAHAVCDAALLARAAALRAGIVTAGLTKYNVGHQAWVRPAQAAQVILVVGQVESDASLAYGAPEIRTNMGLLQAVRQAYPQAYVVYKPHPDVLARLRLEGQDEQLAQRWCDELVSDVAMGVMLDAVDEVHVLTSLAGFEALLRGKPVVCYGLPFYAGWGLTLDKIACARRVRRLSVDELVVGTLMRYPLYLSRDGQALLTPEQALDVLRAWQIQAGGKAPWWRRLFRIILRRVAGVR